MESELSLSFYPVSQPLLQNQEFKDCSIELGLEYRGGELALHTRRPRSYPTLPQSGEEKKTAA